MAQRPITIQKDGDGYSIFEPAPCGGLIVVTPLATKQTGGGGRMADRVKSFALGFACSLIGYVAGILQAAA